MAITFPDAKFRIDNKKAEFVHDQLGYGLRRPLGKTGTFHTERLTQRTVNALRKRGYQAVPFFGPYLTIEEATKQIAEAQKIEVTAVKITQAPNNTYNVAIDGEWVSSHFSLEHAVWAAKQNPEDNQFISGE